MKSAGVVIGWNENLHTVITLQAFSRRSYPE